MNNSNVDISCLSNYDERLEKCQECESQGLCIETRRDVREAFIRKLDAGFRQQIIANYWSQGDSLSNEPFDDERRIIMKLQAYMDSHGLTDSGLTNLTNAKLYLEVVEYQCDLTAFLKAWTQYYPKCRNVGDFEVWVEPIEIELEDKYSKRVGERIYGNPSKLLETIKKLIYKDILPKVDAQNSMIASLATRGFTTGFNSASVPRFRRADIDHTPRP